MQDNPGGARGHAQGHRQLVGRESEVDDQSHRGGIPPREPGHHAPHQTRQLAQLGDVVGLVGAIAQFLGDGIVERFLTSTRPALGGVGISTNPILNFMFRGGEALPV